MTGLQTDQAILNALREASKRGVSPEEAREQRLSFVMGSLSSENDLTREQVKKILDTREMWEPKK